MSDDSAQDHFERFVAGEDKLAALLRALPVFEPTAAMNARFAGLARLAQSDYVPAVVAAPAMPLAFEPPASLEAGFLAEAARIQAAQQPRHDAVISQIKAGEPATAVLGHDVTKATAQWLENQAEARERAAAALATARPKTSVKWWQRFGVVLASAAFGVVATNLWLAQRHAETPLATAMNAAPEPVPASAPEAPGMTKKTGVADAASVASAVELKVEPIAQISAVTRPNSVAPSESKRATTERLQAYAEMQRATKLETADVDKADGAASTNSPRDQARERPQERAQERERRQEALAIAKPQAAANDDERIHDAQRSASVAGAVADERQAFRKPAMAAAPAASPPAPVAAAAPQPASPTALAKSRQRADMPLRFGVDAAAQDAASAWQASGRTNAPRIFAAHPDEEEVLNWAERFRQALPADMRPARLRIERDKSLADDVMRVE